MARTTQPKGTPYTRLPPKSSTLSQTPIVPADFSNLFVLDSTPSAVPTESLYTVQDGSTVSLAAQEQEDEEMRIFAIEVAPSDDDLLEDEDEEEDIQEVNVVAMAVYDNPQELEQAIKGKITDDSAAKVSQNPTRRPLLPSINPIPGHWSLLQGNRSHQELRIVWRRVASSSRLSSPPFLTLSFIRRASTYFAGVYAFSVRSLRLSGTRDD